MRQRLAVLPEQQRGRMQTMMQKEDWADETARVAAHDLRVRALPRFRVVTGVAVRWWRARPAGSGGRHVRDVRPAGGTPPDSMASMTGCSA